jgi:ribonucleotide reductase alpha subunit
MIHQKQANNQKHILVMDGIKEGIMALKISYLNEKADVYDITVQDNHNFYANDILVHNCSEIILPTDKDRTAVCCLSSVNLEYYDEWKDNPLFLKDIAEMLDNVLQYFIDHAHDGIARARFSAMRERSIGIGALGFHAYLQKKNLAFEGVMAKIANNKMFSHIRTKLDEANLQLGAERGEAPDIQSKIVFEGDDGNTVEFNSSDTVTVVRNGETMLIRACAVLEGDDLKV